VQKSPQRAALKKLFRAALISLEKSDIAVGPLQQVSQASVQSYGILGGCVGREEIVE